MSKHFLALVIFLSLVPSGRALAAAPHDLTVLTLNLRSHYDQADRRLPIILDFLDESRPDLVLLQEVAQRGDESDAHRLGRALGYHVAHEHNSRTRRGLAILSRHPIRDTVVIELPRKGRPALGVVVDAGGQLFSAVNLHLTPQLEAADIRKDELRSVLKLARTLPGPTVVAGDFNFGDAGPENRLLNRVQDVYREQFPDQPGHTWDKGNNPLARKNSYPTEPSRRLDRILIANRSVGVVDVDVVLDEPVQGGLFPSDHYGLMARLKVFRQPIPRPARAGAAWPMTPQAHQPVLP